MFNVLLGMNGNSFPLYRAWGIFGWLCLAWSWDSAALFTLAVWARGAGDSGFQVCDRQKEEGFSFPFPLPSFRISQLCQPAPEHSPLLCMAIPSSRTKWEVLINPHRSHQPWGLMSLPQGWLSWGHTSHFYRGEPLAGYWRRWSLRSLPNHSVVLRWSLTK